MTIKVSSVQQGPVFAREHRFITGQNAGLDKIGIDVLPKSAYIVNSGALTGASYDELTKLWTITLVAHGAKKHNFIRFRSGSEDGNETPIYDIPTANTIRLLGKAHLNDIQVGDDIEILRYLTPTTSEDGSMSVSIPVAPAQFIYNGSSQQVVQDDVDPTNNRPMPNLMFIEKDGVINYLRKDTGNPANTLAMPVEIVGVTGTEINITAGDINIHTTDLGVNFDSFRLGDGSGNYAAISALGEMNVTDAQVLVELQTLNLVDFATEAKQDAVISELQDLNLKDFSTEATSQALLTELQTLNLVDFATEAKQDDLISELQTLNLVDFATEAKQDSMISELQDIEADVEAMSAKLPATLGQKTMANSLAVTLASDQSSLPITLPTPTPSYQEITNLTTSAQTFTAPANAKWAKVQADDTNTANVRVKIGGAATISSGIQMQPGRSEDFMAVGDISVIAESGTNQKVYVQFGV